MNVKVILEQSHKSRRKEVLVKRMKYMLLRKIKTILITEMFIKKISYFYRDG
jgi:hypothetical protein